ncbi:MAG: CBS domain-containing protein [Hyphomonadaceae bacterium]|nr:CBS domain-containing protein [Hyphomonadaceae bacterium]
MLIAQVIGDKGAVVHSLAACATLEEAARELNEKRVGALVVIDAEGAIIGVFSERDLVRELARHGADALGRDVAHAMSREIITAHPDETIDDCLGRMTDRRVRHLPVVVDEIRLIGIVSIGDLVKHRIAVAEAENAAMQAYIAAQ